MAGPNKRQRARRREQRLAESLAREENTESSILLPQGSTPAQPVGEFMVKTETAETEIEDKEERKDPLDTQTRLVQGWCRDDFAKAPKLPFQARQILMGKIENLQNEDKQNARYTTIGHLFKSSASESSKVESLSLKLYTEEQELHKTQLHIQYYLRTRKSLYDKEYYQSDVMSVQFTAKNTISIEYAPVDASNLSQMAQNHHLTPDEQVEILEALQNSANPAKLHELTIYRDTNAPMFGRNLFTEKKNYGPIYMPIVEDLRAFWGSEFEKVTFLIQGPEFESTMEIIKKHQSKQRTVDAWRALYQDPGSVLVVQAGRMKPIDDRPQYRLAAQFTFQTFEEYATIMGMGAIEEFEYEQAIGRDIKGAKLYLAAVPGKEKAFFAVAKIPGTEKHSLIPGTCGKIEWTPDYKEETATGNQEEGCVTIPPGEGEWGWNADEKVKKPKEEEEKKEESLPPIEIGTFYNKINGEDDGEDTAMEEWIFTIVDHLAFCKDGDIAMILHEPERHVDSKLTQYTPTAVLDFNLHNFATAERALYASKPNFATLSSIISEISKKNRLRVLEEFRLDQGMSAKPQIVRCLLANDHTRYERADWFETILHNVHAQQIVDQYTKDFDAGQNAALQLARKAPLGLTMVHGVPGSGKTYLAVGCILPLLVVPQENQERHQVLVIAPTNTNVDAFALQIHEAAKIKLPAGPPRVIIRAHSYETELAATGRTPGNAKESLKLTTPESTLSTHLLILANTYRAYFDMSNGVPDRRFKLEELSTAIWMLRYSGVIEHPYNMTKSFKNFRHLLGTFRNGNLTAEGDIVNYKNELRRLWTLVLRNADIVVATPMTAMTKKFASALYDRITHVVMDEAGRISEQDTLQLFAIWQRAAKLVIGDPNQTRPFSHTDNLDSCHFGANLQLSFLGRMMSTGFTTAMLTKNYRSPRDHVLLFGDAFYNGLLIHDDGVFDRPLTFKFREWVRARTNIITHILLLDAVQTQSRKTGSLSQVNEAQATMTLDVVKALFREGFGTQNIVVLTFYDGQYRFLKQKQDIRKVDDPIMGMVRIDKVDSFMGQESDIVILDTTVTEKPGFLRENNRLIVGLSRARCGMIVIANVACIGQGLAFQGTGLKAIIRKLDQVRKVTYPVKEFLQKVFDAPPGEPVETAVPPPNTVATLTLMSEAPVIPEEERWEVGATSGKAKLCKHCYMPGHQKKDCPQRQEQCYNCGQAGHKKKDCTKPKEKKPPICRVCKVQGHLARNCGERQKINDANWAFVQHTPVFTFDEMQQGLADKDLPDEFQVPVVSPEDASAEEKKTQSDPPSSDSLSEPIAPDTTVPSTPKAPDLTWNLGGETAPSGDW